MSKEIYFLLLLIVLIQTIISGEKSIIFPFQIYKQKEYKYYSDEEIFELIENNYLYTKLKLGNPPKELPALFTLYNSSLSIHSNLDIFSPSEFSYNPLKSKSFINYENNTIQEELIFNLESEEIIKNFTFLYHPENKTDKILYINVGLQNFYNEFTSDNVENPNFLYQLKEQGLIDHISYNINYTSDNTGFININIEPNEYAPNLYSNKKKKTAIVKGVTSKAINKLGEYLWSMDIDKLFYENKENGLVLLTEEHYKVNEDQYYVILNPRYGAIKGPYIYKKLIEKDFFNELKEKDICSLNRKHKKLFYTCKSKYKNEIKEKFPTLYFYHKDFNYTFELDYEDLFYEKNNKLYFLICFDTGMFGDDKFTEISDWIFGKPFMKKYQFSFDVESRIIRFYENLNGYANNTNKNTHLNKYIYSNNFLSIKNLPFIIFFLLILFFSFFYILKSFKIRKTKFVKKTKIDKIEEGKEYIELEDNLIVNNKQ